MLTGAVCDLIDVTHTERARFLKMLGSAVFPWGRLARKTNFLRPVSVATTRERVWTISADGVVSWAMAPTADCENESFFQGYSKGNFANRYGVHDGTLRYVSDHKKHRLRCFGWSHAVDKSVMPSS